MRKDQLSRKLAVILHADVVGSTALVQKNETLAHERIQAVFHQFSETITSYGGRTHELRGDALVAEFDRASDAVTAALVFQVLNGQSNATLDDEMQPQLRIGISLGEVIIADNTVTGAGVVLAQRIEQLADKGGVVVQGAVSETVPTRMPFDFESLGEHKLKGFELPVRAFSVRLKPGETIPEPESDAHDQGETALPDIPAEAHVSTKAGKPSIAVLPFDNMSGDPEQEYFSDGITEDIITELSRFRSLFVIARNSSFAFKGQAIDVTDVAEKLGVQYVVDGSVRKAGDRIRITAQLIEASTGNHLWAERYDRNLEDIFAVQDEVASEIVTMVPGHVDIANRVQAERKPAKDLNAYDLVLRAENTVYQSYSSRDDEHLLIQALEIDPNYARAHAGLAVFYAYGVFAHGLSIEEATTLTCKHAEAALKQGLGDPMIHAAAAISYSLVGEHVLAGHHMDKAISLNPHDTWVISNAGAVKAYLGDYDSAVKWIDKAALIDPFSPDHFRENYFDTHFIGGQYELALEQFVGWHDHPPHNYLGKAAALALLGRIDEACNAVQQYEKNRPEGWDRAEILRAYAGMCAKPEDGERWLEGFRKAGINI
ncbi:MAG: hypothetical protein GY896_13550 [Gammaproteobacteria bacterium]|nr:hypothetical protein [Gammaproteobacteria bacterium]